MCMCVLVCVSVSVSVCLCVSVCVCVCACIVRGARSSSWCPTGCLGILTSVRSTFAWYEPTSPLATSPSPRELTLPCCRCVQVSELFDQYPEKIAVQDSSLLAKLLAVLTHALAQPNAANQRVALEALYSIAEFHATALRKSGGAGPTVGLCSHLSKAPTLLMTFAQVGVPAANADSRSCQPHLGLTLVCFLDAANTRPAAIDIVPRFLGRPSVQRSARHFGW